MATSHLPPLLLACLLPAASLLAQEQPRHAVITKEGSKLHAFYDPHAAVVLEAAKDLPVEVIGELVPWSKVRVPGGLDVWVHRDFVVFDKEGRGTLTRGNVNIRPLPSTGPESHPLGHFDKEQAVWRLAVDGDWVQVRCDPNVPAWIETRFLEFPQVEEQAWAKRYQLAASARAPEILRTRDQAKDEAVAEGEAVTEDAAQPVDAEAPAAAVGQSEEAAASLVAPAWHLSEAVIAADPAQARQQAGAELERFATLVTRADDNWDRQRADALADVLGKVLWHAADVEVLDLARADLARLDGLRRFYLASLQGRQRGAQAAGRSAVAAVLAQKLAKEHQPYTGDGASSVVVSGWVVRKVLPGGQASLRLERGKTVIPLVDQDGLHDLPALRGRELVVRGVWQEQARFAAPDAGLAASEGQLSDKIMVFVVRELRALPARGE